MRKLNKGQRGNRVEVEKLGDGEDLEAEIIK